MFRTLVNSNNYFSKRVRLEEKMKIVHINNVFVVVENGRKETGHNILDEKDPQEGKRW